MTILDSRTTWLPIEYPWAFEAFKTQNEKHWMPNEATALPDDINDYKNKLSDDERGLVTQILRFFTQTDIDVANGYTKVYMPKFKKPELTMAMSSFAAMEAIHIFAYSQVVDTLGLPESEYSKFLEYAEMRDKHEFLWDELKTISGSFKNVVTMQNTEYQSDDQKIPQDVVEAGREAGFTDKKIEEIYNLAYGLAKFSAFAEGLQLFSSFAMLLNFKRFGLMKGMGQIVAWSIRDESLHVETMIKVFREIIHDFPWLWTESFKEEIYKLARKMVDLEFKFIELAYKGKQNGINEFGIPEYEQIELRGLPIQDIKDFVKLTCDDRLESLGLNKIYNVAKNPLPWFNILVAGEEHSNFFEQRGTSYAKGTIDTSKINFDEDMDFNTNFSVEDLSNEKQKYNESQTSPS
jgi:ribonucleoside-diphosphate reductase beta chain